MKAMFAITVTLFIISCTSAESSAQKEQRYYEAYRIPNPHEYQQEPYRPDNRQQPYPYIQQDLNKQPHQNSNGAGVRQYNRFQKMNRHRVFNDNQRVNHHDNYQDVPSPATHIDQSRKIIYQAVPYPVPVPQNLYRNPQVATNQPDFEIQQAIPIYMARQIFQVNSNGALELISEEELRNPGPDSNFNQQLLPPLFMQYPISVVKNQQQ